MPARSIGFFVIHEHLTALDETGWVIVISPGGDIAWSFNTLSTHRGKISADSKPEIAIFWDEDWLSR